MRRPVWAAAPGFSRAWAVTEQTFQREDDDVLRQAFSAADFNFGRTRADDLLRLLQRARVIAVESAQMNALPLLAPVDDVAAMVQMAGRLPFPDLFLCLDGASAKGEEEALGVGVLMSQPSLGSLAMIPFSRIGGEAAALVGAGTSAADVTPAATWVQVDGGSVTFTNLSPFRDQAHEPHWRVKIWIERALAVMVWLQSFNVALAPAPLRPRELRRATAKGREVALVVQVRAPSRSARRMDGPTANYSHRFEVAGHYIHHFATKADGTPNLFFERCLAKRPDKVIQLDGRDCFRLWQRPHVKGPVDKPLVPKLRVVESMR